DAGRGRASGWCFLLMAFPHLIWTKMAKNEMIILCASVCLWGQFDSRLSFQRKKSIPAHASASPLHRFIQGVGRRFGYENLSQHLPCFRR
uniref:Secreted protein n=1 Tax=Myripristis murdjan TaxID=586833 RepID=A0A667WFE5_9TELE